MSRDDLWRRLLEAHANAGDLHDRAGRASRDRGAVVDALIRDGATYQAVADALGMSRTRAHRLHQTYLEVEPEQRERTRCKVCGRTVSITTTGRLNRHGNPQCEGSYTRQRSRVSEVASTTR